MITLFWCNNAFATWTPLLKDGFITWHLDYDSFKKNNNEVGIKILMDALNGFPNDPNVKSSIIDLRIECKTKAFRFIQTDRYSDNMGKGILVYSKKFEIKTWVPVKNPDTIWGNIIREFC